MRQRIAEGLRIGGLKRRKRYENLTYESFTSRKIEDGRFYTFYWDTDNVKRSLYRYQWVWETEKGKIPEGLLVDHTNGDCTDDRIGNLQLMTKGAHASLHMSQELMQKMANAQGITLHGVPTWVCIHCGKQFQRYDKGGQPRKYCSQKCHYASKRKTPDKK